MGSDHHPPILVQLRNLRPVLARRSTGAGVELKISLTMNEEGFQAFIAGFAESF
jgi:hypothetical protein